MTDSYKPVLDREGVAADVQEHLAGPISLLKELVDYGTALIPRAFASSPRDFQATYLLMVQLHQFLGHLDSAQELLGKGCCFSVSLQLRSLLEGYMTLKWILENDTAKKIDHIFVANLRKRRAWQAIAVPGSPEALSHPDEASNLPKDSQTIASVKREIANLDSLLSDSRYSAINQAFNTARGKRDHDPQWYQVLGTQSIRAIAIANGRKKDYELIIVHFPVRLTAATSGRAFSSAKSRSR